MRDEIQAHYDRLAGSYDENWAYSQEFINWMTDSIIDRLGPDQGDRVADIGCGTGLYAKGLAERSTRVVCVDPSAMMLKQLPSDGAYIPVLASAEQIASREVRLPIDRLDVILVKEAIHHVRDRRTVISGLADLLAPKGRLLVVMLPTHIDYPLFEEAIRLFERLQPNPEDLVADMQNAGLHADLTYEHFPLSFSKARYLGMVRNRYMSLLSNFDDEQIEQGITEIDERHPGDRLDFPDRFAFVRGVRT